MYRNFAEIVTACYTIEKKYR